MAPVSPGCGPEGEPVHMRRPGGQLSALVPAKHSEVVGWSEEGLVEERESAGVHPVPGGVGR